MRDVGSDDARWDAFVQGAFPGSYLQLSGWARVKAPNGWWSRRLVAGAPDGPIGAQVLLRRPRGFPWAFAYAPRGPVAASWSDAALSAFTERVGRELRAEGRVSHLRIDPEIEAGGPLDPDGMLRASLRRLGWRPAVPIQPASTIVVDLTVDEQALWDGLRKKWRQYVNKARAGGIRVVEADEGGLGDFYRIYSETARRAGFPIRIAQAYRDVWDAFRPTGLVSLLLAVDADGRPVATLLLLRCGTRIVEPYGGMTTDGASSRANYLLKWEAIRRAKAEGATVYDLWGLAHAGIAHFKSGFGGRVVEYVGAWDLVLDPLGRLAFETARRMRLWIGRRRSAPGTEGAGPA